MTRSCIGVEREKPIVWCTRRVVSPDIEYVHITLATGPCVTGAGARTDNVQLCIVWRKRQPVWIRQLLFTDDDIEAPARIHTVDIGWQFALPGADLRWLTEVRLASAR